ncbi:MAG: hypothetical protein RR687_05635 [Comamonas sp.]
MTTAPTAVSRNMPDGQLLAERKARGDMCVGKKVISQKLDESKELAREGMARASHTLAACYSCRLAGRCQCVAMKRVEKEKGPQWDDCSPFSERLSAWLCVSYQRL